MGQGTASPGGVRHGAPARPAGLPKFRWAAVKLGLVGLASVATVGLFSLVLTWWSSPMDSALPVPYGHRLILARFGPVLLPRATSRRSATPPSPSPWGSRPGC